MRKSIIILIFLTITSLGFSQEVGSADIIIACEPSIVVKSPPQFLGGDDSLMSFIKRNLKWPSPEWCGEGKVYIQFTVDTLGQIKDPKVLRGIDSTANQAALRVITLMPNWLPGRDLDGKKITTTMVLPIKFTMR